MAYTQIDLAHWQRRETLALFRRFEKPQYTVTSRIDVTNILNKRAKDNRFSSYLACIYAVGAALHQVPELRLRIRGKQVVEHETVVLSPTLLFKDGRLGFTYLDWHSDFEHFSEQAREMIEGTLALGVLKPGIEGYDGVAFLSCQPNLDFTSFENPVFDRDDSIPRITWGRYTDAPRDRKTIAVALQLHHGLADGSHVAQFFHAMQAAADRF